MKAYETSAKVEDLGQVRIADVPFAPGTTVEVTISSKRRSAEQFTAAWERVCTQLRSSPSVIASGWSRRRFWPNTPRFFGGQSSV